MVRQNVNHNQSKSTIILLLVWFLLLPALSIGENEPYHGGSYDGYDMSKLEESPLSNDLPSPENVVISISSNTVHIEWSAVSGATSYKVYTSDDPYSGFVEDTSGTFDGTSWTAQVSGEKKFYYVTAEN